MARLPYADPDTEATRPLAQRIVAERGSILHLYQMLLHSPSVAKGWLGYLTAIRQQSTLSGAMREMVIIRVAQINRAPYEAEQHIPIARQEGVSADKLEVLDKWVDSSLFDETERAVLAYTDAMTRNVQVDDVTFEQVKKACEAQQLIELTATVAAYNMVSRFLEALQIHSTDHR